MVHRDKYPNPTEYTLSMIMMSVMTYDNTVIGSFDNLLQQRPTRILHYYWYNLFLDANTQYLIEKYYIIDRYAILIKIK